MKIVKKEGCMAWCLDADGKPIKDMNEAEKLEIFAQLCRSFNVDSGELIEYIVRKYGEYSCSEKPCEECGDYIETWETEIPDIWKTEKDAQ